MKEHRQLTDADVWQLLSEDCNTLEIADYAGVSVSTASAMVGRAQARYRGDLTDGTPLNSPPQPVAPRLFAPSAATPPRIL